MTRRLFFLLCAVFSGGLFAQYPVVTIQQIQTVSQMNLTNCQDTASFFGDTIITHGTVTMDGGLSQNENGNNIWIQSGSGPFSGIDIYGDDAVVPIPVPGTSILDLVAGDSIEITAIVTEFGHESELYPLNIQVLDFGKKVYANPVDVADLNDDNRVNQLETGEEWEGTYVELYNVVAQEPSFFSGGNRVSFNVADAAGNLINVSDRFLVQRLPVNGGTFVPFAQGTVLDTLRGVIAHSANGSACGANGRGYEMYPFQASDYVIQQGSSPPQIANITRNPTTPTSSQDVNVSATISDPDGTVSSGTLFYAVGISNNNYLSVPMTNSGSTYTGTIPATAFSDGDLVKYYICSEDNDYLSSCIPDVPGGNFDPLFFTARDNGLTIYDLQFTPFDNGTSGYVGIDVTVTGIVTATAQANDLGFVYIQQPGQTQWAGINLRSGDLTALQRGDEVTVSGQVQESFGLTVLSITGTPMVISQGNTLPDPVELAPENFTNADILLSEPYEGMLVRLVNPTAGDGVYVVDQNPAAPNNFAEYIIGSNEFDPLNGCRIQAGRSSSSNFSSLSFSYVNDSSWITNEGLINVPVCIVTNSDTMEYIQGIMDYGFGVFKLLPRNNDDVSMYSGANCKDGIGGNPDAILDAWAGSRLDVYPNPAYDQLTISYEFPRLVDGQIELVDLMGRSILTNTFSATSGKTTFTTSSLSQGTYLLRVRTGAEIIAYEKVVILN